MQEIFNQIKEKEEINSLLETFKPYLTTLSTGQANSYTLAEKLAAHGVVLVLCVNETVAGFVAFYCNDFLKQQAFISLLAVLPEYRRKGIGQQLLYAAVSYAIKAGMKTCTLEVRKDNLTAIDFYYRNHFVFLDKETQFSRFMTLPLHEVFIKSNH